MKLAKKILRWIIALMFIATGIMKLIQKDEMSLEIFSKAHYPITLFYLVGLMECAAGILLLIPSTRRWSIFPVSVIMIGAVFTHIYLGDHWGHMIGPVVIMVLTVIVSKKL